MGGSKSNASVGAGGGGAAVASTAVGTSPDEEARRILGERTSSAVTISSAETMLEDAGYRRTSSGLVFADVRAEREEMGRSVVLGFHPDGDVTSEFSISGITGPGRILETTRGPGQSPSYSLWETGTNLGRQARTESTAERPVRVARMRNSAAQRARRGGA